MSEYETSAVNGLTHNGIADTLVTLGGTGRFEVDSMTGPPVNETTPFTVVSASKAPPSSMVSEAPEKLSALK